MQLRKYGNGDLEVSAAGGKANAVTTDVTFARIVAFAIGQPEEVTINEILFRSTAQEQ
jgi:NADP-dependent 3-hydroxy acid dehydrogenase YdfG